MESKDTLADIATMVLYASAAFRKVLHAGRLIYVLRNPEYGTHCMGCHGKHTPTSIHGACLDCGYQKYPSSYRYSKKRTLREA